VGAGRDSRIPSPVTFADTVPAAQNNDLLAQAGWARVLMDRDVCGV